MQIKQALIIYSSLTKYEPHPLRVWHSIVNHSTVDKIIINVIVYVKVSNNCLFKM